MSGASCTTAPTPTGGERRPDPLPRPAGGRPPAPGDPGLERAPPLGRGAGDPRRLRDSPRGLRRDPDLGRSHPQPDRGPSGERIHHLGPERDAPIFAGLDLTLVPAEAADRVVCTGLFDDTRETAEDYRATLADLRARDVPMLCANPDLVVERGGKLIPCAGLIAEAYEALGGRVTYAGKPHRPVYAAALALAAGLDGGRSLTRPVSSPSATPCGRTSPEPPPSESRTCWWRAASMPRNSGSRPRRRPSATSPTGSTVRRSGRTRSSSA